MNKGLNLKTAEHLKKCIEGFDLLKDSMRIGDYVITNTGDFKRICNLSDKNIQLTKGGSFRLSASGSVSYSGGLEYPVEKQDYKKAYGYIGRNLGADFWICENGILEADCAVHVNIQVSVWQEKTHSFERLKVLCESEKEYQGFSNKQTWCAWNALNNDKESQDELFNLVRSMSDSENEKIENAIELHISKSKNVKKIYDFANWCWEHLKDLKFINYAEIREMTQERIKEGA